MNKFFLYLVLLLAISSIVSCSTINHLDAPSPPTAMYWKKLGFTYRMNEIALVECGYPVRPKSKNVDEYVKNRTAMENCMLNQGFKFSPTGWPKLRPDVNFYFEDVCNFEVNKKYPSCQSIHKKTKGGSRTDNSMHSCYGTGAAGCEQVEIPVPGGPQGTPEGNSKLIRYRGGQQVDAFGNTINNVK